VNFSAKLYYRSSQTRFLSEGRKKVQWYVTNPAKGYVDLDAKVSPGYAVYTVVANA